MQQEKHKKQEKRSRLDLLQKETKVFIEFFSTFLFSLVCNDFYELAGHTITTTLRQYNTPRNKQQPNGNERKKNYL